jgi:hypothetical protein
MDFTKLLQDKLAEASAQECEAYYRTVQVQVQETLVRNGHVPGSEVAMQYGAKLENAIHQHRQSRQFNPSLASPAVPLAPVSASAYVPLPNVRTQAAPSVDPPASTEQAETSTPAGSSPLKKLAAVFAAGTVIGAFGVYLLSGPSAGPLTNMATHFESSMPLYERNVAYLKAMEAAVARHRQGGGRMPISENFEVFSTVFKDIPAIASIAKPDNVTHVRLYFKTKGLDYKMTFNRSGDCFIARIKNPELVDPVRVTGPVDCQDYGVWTPGGKEL